jgi:holo-[acyl-carrier protein] synthase
MIGIDAVDVERLRDVMERSLGTEQRLFTTGERNYCRSRVDPVTHFAGTLAVKEAVIKAARLGSLAVWGRRIEVRRDDSGAPRVAIEGFPGRSFAISISHDGPVAVAVAMAHGAKPEPRGEVPQRPDGQPRPNQQLLNYIRGPVRNPTSQLPHVSGAVLGTDFP